MIQDFDVFVKEHLQNILCEAEKEHALSTIRHSHVNGDKGIKTHRRLQPETLRLEYETDVQLQDCAVSPSFSQSQL